MTETLPHDWHTHGHGCPSCKRLRAEATAAAEQRLRSGIEAQLAEAQAQWETVLDPEDGLMENGRVAALNGVLALFGSAPPPPPASPRQGEPVAVDIRRKPIPASVVRLMRIEDRPAGRGTVIVHEVDELHPITEACDICQLVTGARLSTDPAEPVAPDKEAS